MTRLGSTAAHHDVGLPAGVEELLVDVVADGFTLHCCGPRAAPRALVASYEWEQHYVVDLLTVRDFARIITARVPAPDRRVDLFDPGIVVWAYEGPPQHAIRALLTLVHPAHPDAPSAGYPAPAGLCVPRIQQRPMTIQLPPPERAGVRAIRLATAMKTSVPTIAGWPLVEHAAPHACSRRPAGYQPSLRCTMPTAVPQPARDRWRDATLQLSTRTLGWLAQRPHAQALVNSVWDTLTELEQAGHHPGALAALRFVLVHHEPIAAGRCCACRRMSWRGLWRRSPFPCVVWRQIRGELLGHLTINGYHRRGDGRPTARS